MMKTEGEGDYSELSKKRGSRDLAFIGIHGFVWNASSGWDHDAHHKVFHGDLGCQGRRRVWAR
jgi:hypothetical protein